MIMSMDAFHGVIWGAGAARRFLMRMRMFVIMIMVTVITPDSMGVCWLFLRSGRVNERLGLVTEPFHFPRDRIEVAFVIMADGHRAHGHGYGNIFDARHSPHGSVNLGCARCAIHPFNAKSGLQRRIHVALLLLMYTCYDL
jgi:hypothetical protein